MLQIELMWRGVLLKAVTLRKKKTQISGSTIKPVAFLKINKISFR